MTFRAPHAATPRLIPRRKADRIHVIPVGRSGAHWSDSYIRLLDASWGRLLLYISCGYVGVNCLFALLYHFFGTISHAHTGDSIVAFEDAFFFSVQTLTTIGYGQMVPEGWVTNLFVALEAFMGLTFYAMITGLVFSKFSRPTSRVLFSNVAVICPYHGVPHLMLRMANERRNRIVDAKAQAVILQEEVSPEGLRIRRFAELPLVRWQVPLMQLTWMVMHKIDEASPLYRATQQSLTDNKAEIIVSLTGLDESFSQTIHARFSYIGSEVCINHMFEDVLVRRDDGALEVHYERFHNTKPFAAPPPMPRAEDDAGLADIKEMCRPE